MMTCFLAGNSFQDPLVLLVMLSVPHVTIIDGCNHHYHIYFVEHYREEDIRGLLVYCARPTADSLDVRCIARTFPRIR